MWPRWVFVYVRFVRSLLDDAGFEIAENLVGGAGALCSAAILVTVFFSAALIFLTQVEAVLVAVTVVLIYLAYGICTASTLADHN